MFVVWAYLVAVLQVACLIPRKSGIDWCLKLCNGKCISETTRRDEEITREGRMCHFATCRQAIRLSMCSWKPSAEHTGTDVLTKIDDSTKNEANFHADFVIVQTGKLFSVSLANNKFSRIETQNLGKKCGKGSLVDFSVGICYWLCGGSQTKRLHYGPYKGNKIIFQYKSVQVPRMYGLLADTKNNFIFARQKNKNLFRINLRRKRGQKKSKLISSSKITSFQLLEQERNIFIYMANENAVSRLDYKGRTVSRFFGFMNEVFSFSLQNTKLMVTRCENYRLIRYEDGEESFEFEVLFCPKLGCDYIHIWSLGNHIFVSFKDKIGLWVLQNRNVTRIVEDLVTDTEVHLHQPIEDIPSP